MRALLLLWLTACVSAAAPTDIDGRYCPIDSLTTYSWGDWRYVPTPDGGGYSLLLKHGIVVPDGLYSGRFAFGDSSFGDGSFVLPLAGVRGSYSLSHDSLRFAWPYPEAGPTWFWEIARHSAPAPSGQWDTVLDDSTHGVGLIQLHFTWERC